jgi:hypothetical protein
MQLRIVRILLRGDPGDLAMALASHYRSATPTVTPRGYPHLCDEGSRAEALALWTIRGALRPAAMPFRFSTAGQTDQWQDLCAIRAVFGDLSDQLAQERGRPLDIATTGQPGVTPDEQHLLLAIAASQADMEHVLQDALNAFGCGRWITAAMKNAVTILGAVLATRGYWLPKPSSGEHRTRLRGPQGRAAQTSGLGFSRHHVALTSS